jgi:hypothetical protein
VASRGIWPWALTVAAGVVVGLLLLALTGDESSEPEAVEQQPSSGAVETRPSAFAREALSARQLELYLSTGGDLGLDWSVLAAVDQIEGAVGPADESERVSAIGYSLEALGAPDDYRLAQGAGRRARVRAGGPAPGRSLPGGRRPQAGTGRGQPAAPG